MFNSVAAAWSGSTIAIAIVMMVGGMPSAFGQSISISGSSSGSSVTSGGSTTTIQTTSTTIGDNTTVKTTTVTHPADIKGQPIDSANVTITEQTTSPELPKALPSGTEVGFQIDKPGGTGFTTTGVGGLNPTLPSSVPTLPSVKIPNPIELPTGLQTQFSDQLPSWLQELPNSAHPSLIPFAK
jgi:hypothetical protein